MFSDGVAPSAPIVILAPERTTTAVTLFRAAKLSSPKERSPIQQSFLTLANNGVSCWWANPDGQIENWATTSPKAKNAPPKGDGTFQWLLFVFICCPCLANPL
ncbi:hypothetical protein R9C00_19640 [Flammeovirgaceae bacterium SG7u.111]|nr:hypothetical protein R9C00_19640 [Flammeovirgaceae bacterium SG7u.111]